MSADGVFLIENVVFAAGALQKVDIFLVVGSFQVFKSKTSSIHMQQGIFLLCGESIHSLKFGVIKFIRMGKLTM